MFEDLIRELGRMHGTQKISVSLPSDSEGYFDRECPSPECLCQFKVHEDDWRDKARDEEVFCAFCGHAAPSDKWCTAGAEHPREGGRRGPRSRGASAAP